MRLLPGSPLALLLALLLIGTTPMGTGAGIHQFDLVHPLFSHVHLVNGRVLTHEQIAQREATSQSVSTRGPAGPSVGAGSGSGPLEAGVGISPTLPPQVLTLPTGQDVLSVVGDVRLPVGRVEPPPDPPPTSAASSSV